MTPPLDDPGEYSLRGVAHGPKADPPRASDLLAELSDLFQTERITVGELVGALKDRAFGLLLLLLALPNCIPNVPGLSTVFGALMIAPAVQLILGRKALWLPQRVCKWGIQREHVIMAIRGALPILRRLERMFKPRWTFLLKPPFTVYLGLQTLLLAIVLIIPIPAGNWPPGITVAATAIALLQRDGLLALLSIPLTIISVAIAYVGLLLGAAALVKLSEIFQTMLNWAF